jgi:hypothetical protein
MTEVETSMARTAVRPFRINVPEEELVDLRRRILATRWPDKETIADQSQGVPLATMQALARYWATEYDWRTCEATLNALPQFITEIDGLDIHFIHVRSKHGSKRTTRRPHHFKAVVTSQGDCHESRESRGGPTESRPV